MKYIVHEIDVNPDNIQARLENFINQLSGEVLAIMPNMRPTFQLMGATAKVHSMLIVEKIE